MATRTRKKATVNKRAEETRTVIRKTYKFEGDDTPEEETVEVQVHEFVSEPAYIRAGAGVTKNLGNYESLRVDVAITMPCYPEEVEAVYGQAADKVAELLDAEVDTYMNSEEKE